MSLIVGLAGIAVMVAGLIALLVSLVKKGDKKPPRSPWAWARRFSSSAWP